MSERYLNNNKNGVIITRWWHKDYNKENRELALETLRR